MAKRKTQATKASVSAFIRTVPNATRRKDSAAVAELMASVSGEKPILWGTSIIGCGKHHYTYANGEAAEICKIGFAPRATSLVFYLGKFPGKAALLKQLGKHRVRGGCLYITKLADVDLDVLEKILTRAYWQNAHKSPA